MSIYSDKLAHVQVVINCRYSLAQMCTREDTLAHNFEALYFDDVMSYKLLTTEGKTNSSTKKWIEHKVLFPILTIMT